MDSTQQLPKVRQRHWVSLISRSGIRTQENHSENAEVTRLTKVPRGLKPKGGDKAVGCTYFSQKSFMLTGTQIRSTNVLVTGFLRELSTVLIDPTSSLNRNLLSWNIFWVAANHFIRVRGLKHRCAEIGIIKRAIVSDILISVVDPSYHRLRGHDCRSPCAIRPTRRGSYST